VITEVNSAVHAADSEADPKKRAFTRPELQALFDYADEQVALKRSAGRKGWLPAFRDATLLKVASGSGCAATRPACWTPPSRCAGTVAAADQRRRT